MTDSFPPLPADSPTTFLTIHTLLRGVTQPVLTALIDTITLKGRVDHTIASLASAWHQGDIVLQDLKIMREEALSQLRNAMESLPAQLDSIETYSIPLTQAIQDARKASLSVRNTLRMGLRGNPIWCTVDNVNDDLDSSPQSPARGAILGCSSALGELISMAGTHPEISEQRKMLEDCNDSLLKALVLQETCMLLTLEHTQRRASRGRLPGR